MKIIKRYFRSNNRKTWGPMLGSLVLQFLTIFLGHLFSTNTTVFWVLFGISCGCWIAFGILAFCYVNKWHRYAEMLNIDEGIMFKTAAFLIAMGRSSQFNDYQLKHLHVTYKLEKPKSVEISSGKERTFFPFSVTYSVSGVATRPVSEFSFHLLTHPNSRKNKNFLIEYSTNPSDVQSWRPVELKQAESKHILLCKITGRNYTRNENIEYAIRLTFDNSAGIAADGSSRLLLYPANFSREFAHINKNNTVIDVAVPVVYDQLLKDPQLRLFGEKESPNPMGRTMSFDEKRQSDPIYYSHHINANEDTLVAIEFCAK